MVIRITRREVLNNLIRFNDSLLKHKENLFDEEPEPEILSQERTYIALLNRHTGEIRFSKKVNIGNDELSSAFDIKGRPVEWKEIQLVAENGNESVHFRCMSSEGVSLRPVDIDPLAIRILFETLDVLNQLASLYHPVSQELPEKTVLKHLSDLHIAPVPEAIESMQGWSGRLSRIQAEEKLLGLPRGTYLLRNLDQWTVELEQMFVQANKMQVKLYVLTFVEEQGKISDRLLVLTQWGWTVALDEVDLSSSVYEYHSSLNVLLSFMNHLVKTPL